MTIRRGEKYAYKIAKNVEDNRENTDLYYTYCSSYHLPVSIYLACIHIF